MARDQGPDVVLNPQQMNILIPTVSPESVEALVFDLGGVLLDVQLQRTLRAFEALDIRGLGAAEVIDGNRACFRDLELGLISQEEFAEAVRRTFPAVAAIPDEQLLEAWNAMLMPFDAQRVELLRELGKRCPVYLLSNTNLPHRIRFRESFRERFGGSFDELFVRCFYSDELHLRKPDPEIYRSVARQIGTPPGKLLFIDDNAANVSAARGEGWQACHLTGGITVTDLFRIMISLIVAVAENGVIGDRNALLWHISEDLRHFKAVTTGHPVVMGRKTWESLGRPLPNRTNVVITRQNIEIPGYTVVHSLEEAVALFPADEEVFVIGGAQIYAAALPLARKFYLTRVFRAYEGDTRFPAWDEREWRLVSSESFSGGKDYPWPFAFELYERR